MTDWLGAPAVAVDPGPIVGSVRAPASKSLTNRAILLAALAQGTSTIQRPLLSLDTEAMIRVVDALGALVTWSPDQLVIEGTGGRVCAIYTEADAGLSGTSLRFGLAAAALGNEAITLTGEPPLLRRPIGALTEALRQLGAAAVDNGGFAPVTVRGPLAGGEVTVDVSGSSQFLSAILMAAPYAQRDVTVTAVGSSAESYIAMTADQMRRWGVDVTSPAAGVWQVAAGAGYTARDEAVEYDASAAAHLYALAAATGGVVTVTNAVSSTSQPDAGIVDVLTAMGCQVDEVDGAVSVHGPQRLLPIDVDLASMPDQLPTVAVLATLAEGTSSITGAAVTRGHETDRIAAVATELAKLGVDVQERPDGLLIRGGTASGPARLKTYDDHRLAMAFAALSLRVAGVVIDDPGCVAKTYPAFWNDLAGAGAVLREAS